MIHYIIQILIFQTLFLAVYDLFLKRETFFQWNRAYLIITSILAYIIPFIKINSVSNYMKEDLDFEIPTILINSNTNYLDEIVIGNIESSFQLSTLEIIYLIGILFTMLLFLYKISQIYRKITQNKIIKNKDYNLVILPKQPTAFSFFSYLFLGKSIYNKEHQHIIDHELIHIKQKHSLDLLFFEIQKIIFWMNPFSYLFQHRIATLHEYIADAKAIKEHPKQQFFENLLNQTFQIEKFAFINQFYKKSLIKKRIIMVTKNKSKEILKLKYLLLLPLLFTMLIYSSSFAQDNNKDIVITENGDINTIVKYDVNKSEFNKVYKYKDLDKFPFLAKTSLTDNRKKGFELIQELISLSFKKFNHNNNKEQFVVPFIINSKGNIVKLNYNEVPSKYLNEIKNITNSFNKKIIAGKKNGAFVDTQFAFYFGSNTDTQTGDSVPFSVLTKTPIYPGCENPSNKTAKKCTKKEISNHVARNFNTELANSLHLPAGVKRISLQFIIDKNGDVTNVKARAPHPKLQEEAIRVIKLMPKMSAGEHEGKPVAVRYNLPIKFKVNDDQKITPPPPPPPIKSKKLSSDIPPPPPTPINTGIIEDIPFSVIEEIPVYPGCENSTNKKKCFIEKITKHVSKNFNIDLAKSLGLSSGKKRISVQFKIDTNGNVTNIRSRAPHPKLQEEAARIIKLLPKMEAGKQRGKAVNVRYNLPIVFEVKGDNNLHLEGTIDNHFGYLFFSKKDIPTSRIGALHYKNNIKYKVLSFNIKIENRKPLKIIGNRFNNISIQQINELEAGSSIKIYNIIASDKDGKKLYTVEGITLKIKE